MNSLNDLNFLKAMLFFFALSGTVFYVTRLFNLLAYKINPNSFKKPLSKSYILDANVFAIASLFLWSILYYLSL